MSAYWRQDEPHTRMLGEEAPQSPSKAPESTMQVEGTLSKREARETNQ